MAGSTLLSSMAGILELGFTLTNPLLNWSPSIIWISQASYSASRIPFSSNSSNMIVAFTPLGVAREYSWKGCLPTGNSLSWVGPAVGRLILENLLPLSGFHFHTLGGV